MTPAPKWVALVGAAFFAAWGLWSLSVAWNLPLDYWDAYDYLVNARYFAGHDMARLGQAYRAERGPGISLLVAPLLWLGYAPGQRGTAGLVHLVPWAMGVLGVVLLVRSLLPRVGLGLALLAGALLVLNPLMLHYLPRRAVKSSSYTPKSAALSFYCARRLPLLM
ncbi:MAG: hypothetical protein MUC96_33185 [Myxococcaceae bacterium]|nr:hypothetical protein [Myxococcaceae bacterium]